MLLLRFLNSHPGGPNIILRFAGQDATAEYDPIHPPGLLDEVLPASANLGEIDPATIPKSSSVQTGEAKKEPNDSPLSSLINLDDFEHLAKQYLAPNAWAYYFSGAYDEVSKKLNQKAFQKVYLRPRVLRNVGTIDTRTTILGQSTSMPVFVCPAAMAKLAHPDGECAIATGVGKEGFIQVVSTSSSMSIEAIMAARVSENQPILFQLYVNKDIRESKALIQRAEKSGVRALWVTVDSPVIGKREMDERLRSQVVVCFGLTPCKEKAKCGGQAGDQTGAISEGQEVKGIARTMSVTISPEVSWKDLTWIRETTQLPLVIKGIQSVEDAVLAYEHGVQGIVLSNHGGRSQDTYTTLPLLTDTIHLTSFRSQAPLLTLPEIRKYAPFLIWKIKIYLDGGIRRGTDILKAIALGATTVGLGRPFLYGLSTGYGEAGVRRVVSILRGELVSNMALAGTTHIREISEYMVNTKRLERDLTASVKL
jgi:L-lactate dehydrogenase (cytochrome)